MLLYVVYNLAKLRLKGLKFMKEKYPDTLNEVRLLFGDNLRRIRISRKMLQREVATLFGVHTTNIHAMEKGAYTPSLRNLCVLANILDTKIEDFFKK